eukprot:gene57388-biopygen5436
MSHIAKVYAHKCANNSAVRLAASLFLQVLLASTAVATPPSGRTPAVPSATSPYVQGEPGSNECPASSYRLASEAECRDAAAVLGGAFNWAPSERADNPEDNPMMPKGCYFFSTPHGNVWFNNHATGSGYSSHQQAARMGEEPWGPDSAARPICRVATAAPDTTVSGCFCKVEWDVQDNSCTDGDVTYNGCGMFPPCDGDDAGGPTWCEVQGPSGCGQGNEGDLSRELVGEL